MARCDDSLVMTLKTAAEETSVIRDCGKKAQADLNCVLEHKNTHQSPLYQIAKIERCGNSRSIINVSQEC